MYTRPHVHAIEPARGREKRERWRGEREEVDTMVGANPKLINTIAKDSYHCKTLNKHF